MSQRNGLEGSLVHHPESLAGPDRRAVITPGLVAGAEKALGLLAPSASVDGLSREVSAQKIYSLDFIDKLIISYNSNIKLLFI